MTSRCTPAVRRLYYEGWKHLALCMPQWRPLMGINDINLLNRNEIMGNGRLLNAYKRAYSEKESSRVYRNRYGEEVRVLIPLP